MFVSFCRVNARFAEANFNGHRHPHRWSDRPFLHIAVRQGRKVRRESGSLHQEEWPVVHHDRLGSFLLATCVHVHARRHSVLQRGQDWRVRRHADSPRHQCLYLSSGCVKETVPTSASPCSSGLGLEGDLHAVPGARHTFQLCGR